MSQSPLLFSGRRPLDHETAGQYAGTDGEVDIKAPLLFANRTAAGAATAELYHGTDCELDQKDTPGKPTG